MNKNHETIFFSTPGEIRSKYLKDGVVFPLKVFNDNLFTTSECVKKYQEFRKNCEIDRTVPDIGCNNCNSYKINSIIFPVHRLVFNEIYIFKLNLLYFNENNNIQIDL